MAATRLIQTRAEEKVSLESRWESGGADQRRQLGPMALAVEQYVCQGLASWVLEAREAATGNLRFFRSISLPSRRGWSGSFRRRRDANRRAHPMGRLAKCHNPSREAQRESGSRPARLPICAGRMLERQRCRRCRRADGEAQDWRQDRLSRNWKTPRSRPIIPHA